MSALYETEIRESLFAKQFKGYFKGILRWPELDTFWQVLSGCQDENWYIYKIGDEPPDIASSADQFIEFIREIDDFIRENHKEEYCGVVYVDNPDRPAFVKIFHPRNLGNGTCSIHKFTPLPGWILSTTKPVNISVPEEHLRGYAKWWNRIIHAV